MSDNTQPCDEQQDVPSSARIEVPTRQAGDVIPHDEVSIVDAHEALLWSIADMHLRTATVQRLQDDAIPPRVLTTLMRIALGASIHPIGVVVHRTIERDERDIIPVSTNTTTKHTKGDTPT